MATFMRFTSHSYAFGHVPIILTIIFFRKDNNFQVNYEKKVKIHPPFFTFSCMIKRQRCIRPVTNVINLSKFCLSTKCSAAYVPNLYSPPIKPYYYDSKYVLRYLRQIQPFAKASCPVLCTVGLMHI